MSDRHAYEFFSPVFVSQKGRFINISDFTVGTDSNNGVRLLSMHYRFFPVPLRSFRPC
jgi:hypothetical protein